LVWQALFGMFLSIGHRNFVLVYETPHGVQ
jgi:hypothetical protein